MNSLRLIPRLDIKSSKLIKPINLEGLRIVGDPNKYALKYYEEQADELLFMDCVATLYGRNNLSDIITKATQNIFIPITVGGGIRNIDDALRMLSCGADKVAINSQAVKDPKFISELANLIGSQSVVLSIEAKKREKNSWEVFTSNGRDPTGLDVLNWIERGIKLGAGEVLVTSIDREGTGKGFDLDLAEKASKVCEVPLILSGGFGKIEDATEAIKKTSVDALAVADAIHFNKTSIKQIKKSLRLNY